MKDTARAAFPAATDKEDFPAEDLDELLLDDTEEENGEEWIASLIEEGAQEIFPEETDETPGEEKEPEIKQEEKRENENSLDIEKKEQDFFSMDLIPDGEKAGRLRTDTPDKKDGAGAFGIQKISEKSRKKLILAMQKKQQIEKALQTVRRPADSPKFRQDEMRGAADGTGRPGFVMAGLMQGQETRKTTCLWEEEKGLSFTDDSAYVMFDRTLEEKQKPENDIEKAGRKDYERSEQSTDDRFDKKVNDRQEYVIPSRWERDRFQEPDKEIDSQPEQTRQQEARAEKLQELQEARQRETRAEKLRELQEARQLETRAKKLQKLQLARQKATRKERPQELQQIRQRETRAEKLRELQEARQREARAEKLQERQQEAKKEKLQEPGRWNTRQEKPCGMQTAIQRETKQREPKQEKAWAIQKTKSREEQLWEQQRMKQQQARQEQLREIRRSELHAGGMDMERVQKKRKGDMENGYDRFGQKDRDHRRSIGRAF